MSNDRLPPVPPPGQAYSQGTLSPRDNSIASTNGSHIGSQSSFTSVASSYGHKTPSPPLQTGPITGPPTTIVSYDAMNQGQDQLYYSQHMSNGQPQPSQTVTSGGMSHYSQHQPPLLQPGPAQYSNPSPYNQYGYANGLASPGAAHPPISNGMGAPQNVLPLPGVGAPSPSPAPMQSQYAGFDTTGQLAPPGMKPRVTATLWEDEGSLCFQVEARGICVARREDNHMINGTKLLNVAGMTRGRRDGILKSEKVRHVVKIGPMHLKGVWIPYERALDFANKEKITEMLYPLFVHNIGSLLYHPTNTSRTSHVMAAAERRKQEQVRNPTNGLPSIQQHHHHSMAHPGPQPQLPSHNSMGRPPLDRAHSFPTPPTSASGVLSAGMPGSENFNWSGPGMNGGQGTNPLPIDSLSNARSMPNTPATTPPGSSMPNMQSYSTAQGYDTSRPMYPTPSSQQSPYQTSANGAGPHDRMYAQPGSYPKSEMGPPSSRPAVPGDQHDNKPPNGIISSEPTPQQTAGDEEGDHEQEAEYTHDSGAYDATRASYNYNAPAAGGLGNDNNIAPELTGSPSHHSGSGRATPRTAAAPQPYYSQAPGSYHAPPRVQQSTSNLYNVMSNDRAPPNGAAGGDMYAPPADMSSSMTNGYAAQPPNMNDSNGGGMKRQREDEDELSRSANDLDPKRRKTMMEMSVPAPPYDTMGRPVSSISSPRRR